MADSLKLEACCCAVADDCAPVAAGEDTEMLTFSALYERATRPAGLEPSDPVGLGLLEATDLCTIPVIELAEIPIVFADWTTTKASSTHNDVPATEFKNDAVDSVNLSF